MEVSSLRKSNRKNKKYICNVVYNGKFYKNQSFGDIRYHHYRDQTHLKLYSHQDHNDLEKRRLYHTRNRYNTGISAMLSDEFLW